MSAQQVKSSARYLYAVMHRDDALPKRASGPYVAAGLNDGDVYGVREGAVAAVVSDVPDGRFRPERRHLAAHHTVLRNLMDEARTFLPVSFGIVANDAKALRRILSLNKEALCGQLQRVGGKVEMGLKVTWDVPNLFQFFVDNHPELQGLRDRLFRGGREPSQDERIALGCRFGQVLDEDRAASVGRVRTILETNCSEIKENDPRGENEVMRLACLIRRDRQKGFDAAVLKAAEMFDDHFAFDYNGPWPPYNFVDVELET